MISYKRNTVSCLQCKSEISLSNFDRHEGSKQCLKGGKYIPFSRKDVPTNCTHCNKLYKSIRSLAQHEVQCNENPNKRAESRIDRTPCKFCNKVFDKSGGLGNHQIRCPNNPDRKIEIPSIENKANGIKRASLKFVEYWKDPANRLARSERMKEAVSSKPESYSGSNRGRTKQILYNNIKFQGQRELDFYLWCERNNQPVERNKKWFDYSWEGNRKYNPDFYLPDLGIYVEIKGYETDRDRAKWKYFPEKLIIIKEAEIIKIRNNVFTLSDITYFSNQVSFTGMRNGICS